MRHSASALTKFLQLKLFIKYKIVFILLSLLGIHLLYNQASAQLSGWQYITPVVIYENSGANLTDYQVLLTFVHKHPLLPVK